MSDKEALKLLKDTIKDTCDHSMYEPDLSNELDYYDGKLSFVLETIKRAAKSNIYNV